MTAQYDTAATLLAIALLGLVGACASPTGAPASQPPIQSWHAEFERDHRLAGQIWQPSAAQFVTPETMLAALQRADFVLLGEKHDNPDHHRLQAWLLAALIDRGRRPAVAFEMFTSAQQAPLSQHLAAHPGDAAGIAEAVDWAHSGWPEWALYQPIAEAALRGGAPILAAGLPRQTLRDMARQGLGVLGPDRVENLGLDRPRSSDRLARIRDDIAEAHCQQLPGDMVGAMVDVTSAKDATMAAALLRGAEMPGRNGAVLIAGNGHVRADYAVPWYLQQVAPGRRVAILGLVEVEPGQNDAADYAAGYGLDALPFDFVWFTPRASDRDACAEFAEQLKKAREGHSTEPAD